MTSADVPLVVALLDHATLDAVVLNKAMDIRTWRTVPKEKGAAPATGPAALKVLLAGMPAEDAGKPVFIQFRMDELGRHEYLNATALAARWSEHGDDRPPTVFTEEEVKPLHEAGGCAVLASAAISAGPSPVPVGARRFLPAADRRSASGGDDPGGDDLLCPPMSLQANYSVVHDLTLGRTRRVLLSDEATLARGGPNMPPIFNHLTLIVNCHQDASADRPGKYRTGSARPAVIFQPVHKLYGGHREKVVAAIGAITARMWEAQQEGSVVVHCLAGLHRAPAIVACYYLYRRYALGHADVPADVDEIYRHMRAVRPSVAALGYIELIKLYERHLIATYGDRSSQANGTGGA